MIDRIYAPVNAKEKVFQDGGEVVNFGGRADKLIAFIEQNTNSKGYINFVMARRKSVGQYGDTHAVYLDTWQPKQADKPTDEPKPKTAKGSDDLPF